MWSVTGLLDQRGVHVDPALELRGAGPTAGALVFPGGDGPRAGDAADRRVAAIVQGVVGNLVDVQVGLDALRVPVDEGLDLPDAVALRPLDFLGLRARRALLAADARDPGAVVRERALEGLDLAQRAAPVGIGLPEPVRRVDRTEGPKLEAVAADEPVARLLGLGKEHLRVELHDRDVEPELRDHVDENRRLTLPGAREAHAPPELGVGPGEKLLRREALDVR